MNIFFTGSIRGGRAHQPTYMHIVETLGQYGNVSPQYVSDETLSHHGETDITARDISERERTALAKSDVVVAEVTTPSLGVGYLIACATALEKNVIALYRGEDTFKLSAMVKGDPAVEVHTYKTDADIEQVLAKVLGK